MVVPVSGHVPDSTLSPFQVRQKFASQSLAGLGDAWCIDPSVCTTPIMGTDPDTGDPIQTGCGGCSTGSTSGSSWDPYDSVLSSAGITPATAPGISVVSARGDAYGNIYTSYSNGTYTYVDPTGKVLSGVGAPPAAGSGNTTVTAAQANAWASLINSLTQAGVKLGTVAMLQPGQSLTPNGTIVGSNQSLIGPGGTGINVASLSTLFSNPIVLIGGFGILALVVLSGGRR